MHVQHHISLRSNNTFGISVVAERLVEIADTDMLPAVGSLSGNRHVLGGGSNILLLGDVEGIVLLNRLKGITLVREDEQFKWFQVASGEIWHDFVMLTVEQGLGGIENLALIPGTVGAAPIQNIGAYGVEAMSSTESVTVWHWEEGKFITFSNEACHFGYRDSIFKHELKDKAFITSVVFRLSKQPVLNTNYGAIEQELQAMGATPSIHSVAQAVINIRRSKLPDPAVIGNAGSFFKNPAIPIEQHKALLTNYPEMPSYPFSEQLVKIPAGWLIEQCGWKGYRSGDAGVHAKQALVLVNYGAAQGADIWQLSTDILHSVREKFGIELEREVQVW